MSHIHSNESRLLMIEKVLLLKQVSMFEHTPETVLAEVAELLEEEEVPAGHTLFNEGDAGNGMYLIFKGAVRIHKGAHTLVILKENNFFGELSLLDTETRSASATTVSDCLLLKLDQEPFYELMESRVEVARGIITELCRRIRQLNEKAVAAK